MKKIITILFLALFSTPIFAQNDVPFSATDNWIAFVNVSDTVPGGPGAYLWGSPWAVADVQSTLDVGNNTLTLSPNFSLYAADPSDPYWVNQTTGGGAKYLEASTFVEPGAAFNGSDLTFHGDVLSYTLDTTQYDAIFFIKALDSTNSWSDALGQAYVAPIPASGPFTVSVTGAEMPAGLVVQYGFAILGRNANPLDEAALGNVVIGIEGNGINEELETKLRVYPSPATNELYIGTDSEITSFEIVNLAGQIVATAENTSKADLSGLESGAYIINVQTQEGRASRRFIKQ